MANRDQQEPGDVNSRPEPIDPILDELHEVIALIDPVPASVKEAARRLMPKPGDGGATTTNDKS